MNKSVSAMRKLVAAAAVLAVPVLAGCDSCNSKPVCGTPVVYTVSTCSPGVVYAPAVKPAAPSTCSPCAAPAVSAAVKPAPAPAVKAAAPKPKRGGEAVRVEKAIVVKATPVKPAKPVSVKPDAPASSMVIPPPSEVYTDPVAPGDIIVPKAQPGDAPKTSSTQPKTVVPGSVQVVPANGVTDAELADFYTSDHYDLPPQGTSAR